MKLHSWRAAVSSLVGLAATSVAIAGPHEPLGKWAMNDGTHPPPMQYAARYFVITSADDAAAYVQGARFGARLVVYADAAGRSPADARLAQERALEAARRLVARHVYPGAIMVVLAGQRAHGGAVIKVQRLASGF
jgi:hypothetical protein